MLVLIHIEHFGSNDYDIKTSDRVTRITHGRWFMKRVLLISAMMISIASVGYSEEGVGQQNGGGETRTISREDANALAESIRQSVENLPSDTRFDGLRVDSVDRNGVPERVTPVEPRIHDDMVPETRERGN